MYSDYSDASETIKRDKLNHIHVDEMMKIIILKMVK